MAAVLPLMVMLVCPLTLGETVEIGETGVTFKPPKGFKQYPKEVIEQKWPSNRRPEFVVGNESTSTTVACSIKPNQIPQGQLAEIQKSFTTLFEKMIPGLEWKNNKIVEHSGQKWIFMEMTSNAADTDIHNVMLVTGLNGKMLAFNFNSTKEDLKRYEKELRASMKTIKLPAGQ